MYRVLRGVLVTGTAKRRQGDCRPGEEYRIISPEIQTVEVADHFQLLGRRNGVSRYARMTKHLRDSYLRHVVKGMRYERGRSGRSCKDAGKVRQADTRQGRLNATQKSY